MSARVRAAAAAHPDRGAGDGVAVNAPCDGGTHLPDITLVTPVHDPGTGERIFYVSARGHHADVGGIAPGSMPPFSTSIEEEGVQFRNVKVMEKGRFLDEVVTGVLTSGTHPARNPSQNIADMKAQLAACAKGADELHRLVSGQRPGGRESLYGPRPGQCRTRRTPGHRRPFGRIAHGEAG